MLHLKLDKVDKLCGFTMTDLPNDHYGWFMCKGFVHSDHSEFYQYVDQFSDIFLKGLRIDSISSFLVLHHKDLSADVYVNDLPLKIRIMAKRDLSDGELATTKDIADIDELMFEGIEIKEDDCIIFCFKKGWKLGLFFDLIPDGTENFLDVDALYHELGNHYKYLTFQATYAVLENKPQFQKMLVDGWFPFVQILGRSFEQLAVFYRDKDTTFSVMAV